MLKPLAGLLAMLLSGSVAAYAVTVANPSFEDPILADGTHQQGGSGWTFTGADRGTFNPSTSSYGAGAPEGQNVAFISNGGLIQVTTENLAANQTYRIRFAVGNRNDNPLPQNATMLLQVYGYEVSRSADTPKVFIPAFQATIAAPAAGSFVYQDYTFTTNTGTPGLGLPIAIVLSAAPTPSQFNVDDFSLNVGAVGVQRSVPVDQPVALLGLGLLMSLTAGFALRRVHA